MDERQRAAFWDTIRILDEARVLPYVMVIGSWAEYLYSYYFEPGFMPDIRTRDVDFLYPNIRRPAPPIQLETRMKEAGFAVDRDTLTDVVRMFKEDLLEIEFLTRQTGAGRETAMDIPAIGIRGQSLRDVNLLAQHPLPISAEGFCILVPEPSIYVLQKILIQPHRVPASKRPKDIESVRNILPYVLRSERDAERLERALKECTKKELRIIREVCKTHFIPLPFSEI